MLAAAERAVNGLRATTQAGLVKGRASLAAVSDVSKMGKLTPDQEKKFNLMVERYKRKLDMEARLARGTGSVQAGHDRMDAILNYLDETSDNVSIVLVEANINGVDIGLAKISQLLGLMEQGMKGAMLKAAPDYSPLFNGIGAPKSPAGGPGKSARELADEYSTR